MSNVYIFKCSDGTYKIGKADDITRRKPQVEKQFNISAEIYAWKPIDDAIKFESMLHRKHHSSRVHHEFFDLTIEEVDGIVQKYCFILSVNTVLSKSEIISKDPIHVKYNRIVFDLETVIAEKDTAIFNIKNELYTQIANERAKHKKELSEIIAAKDAQAKILAVKEGRNKHITDLANARFEIIENLKNQIKSAESARFIQEVEAQLLNLQSWAGKYLILTGVSFMALIAIIEFGQKIDRDLMVFSMGVFTLLCYFFLIKTTIKEYKAKRLKLTIVLAKPYEIRTKDEIYMLLHKAWKKDSRAKRFKRFLPYTQSLILSLISAVFALAAMMSLAFCFSDFSINILAYFISLSCMAYFAFLLDVKFRNKVDAKAGVLSLRQFNEISTEESIKSLLKI